MPICECVRLIASYGTVTFWSSITPTLALAFTDLIANSSTRVDTLGVMSKRISRMPMSKPGNSPLPFLSVSNCTGTSRGPRAERGYRTPGRRP